MYTVETSGNNAYYVRSPGGKVVDSFPVNLAIPGSQQKAKALAEALADRMNGKRKAA